ncbi:MAG: FtsW/RodA/SpoVE family cell cycle protein [Patescibacteria group bacterium]
MNIIKQQDWKFNFAVLFLGAMGLLSLASTKPDLFYKQLLFWLIGIAFVFLIVVFDWRSLINYRGITLGFYFIIIALLIITYFFAPVVRGVKGWLMVGSFQFQASEFVKLALIIVFARFFKKKHISIARVSNLLVSFVYFFIPALLVAIQPDFGTVIILFFIWFGFLLVSGLRPKHIIVSLLIFSVVAAVMWFSVLENYQKERIIGVFSPGRDALGINYNVIQSKIAIGSAGFFGKGFGQGTQVQLGFLPEAQTDFILAALIEEFGLISGFLAITAFIVLIFRIIRIGIDSEINFNRFICLGAAILFIVQFILNIGSNLGFMPVIGVTFPFLSYGGSSLLTNLIILGIIQSIVVRK